MKLPLLTLAIAALAPAMLTAQQTVTFDDGTVGVVSSTQAGGTIQAAGSLTTTFASNNQFAGNMFDIAPNSDMAISGMDINVLQPGLTCTVDVWYIPGTSFGNEDSAAGWTLIGTFTGTSAGQDLPTYIDMAGNGVVFAGGSTYGIYVDLTSYTGGGTTLRYTNGSGAGNDTYSNADLTITANCGKASGGHAGNTFYPRNWNGTLYYETGGFSLSISSLSAGSNATISTAGGVPGTTVIVGWSLQGGGPTNTPYGPVALSLPIRQLPPQSANGLGETSTMAPIPANAAGVQVWVQALNITGPGAGQISNSITAIL